MHCVHSLDPIMDQSADNDLQGSDGSGILGGPDVRRRIPIKLISKQPIRSKPPPRTQRPGGRPCKSEAGVDDTFGFKQEERFDCGAKSGDVFATQRRFPQALFWDYKLNLIGERDEVPIHFCDKCGLPIQLYGRMIPCKHVFCYDCALLHEKKGEKMCPGLTMYNCTDPVQRIEQSQRGALYMCSVVPGCKRTYLSQRDLQAHVNHRHMRAAKSSAGRQEPVHLPPASEVPDRFRVPPPHLPKNHVHLPNPLQHGSHDPYGQPPPPTPHVEFLMVLSQAVPRVRRSGRGPILDPSVGKVLERFLKEPLAVAFLCGVSLCSDGLRVSPALRCELMF
ncbi:E3 ubiquitin-protein ligase Hakai-like [Etheostoma cragini]|uniref:E3 ubiquitin-protein ligase Hakai-like n=1 Tax=Etheostoma cragini TaxID=417921 RepID=UPI00155E0FD8|nr:E3 ubiquitin-protein ligase Hakai-like [Etheostoma cragini]